MDMCGLDVGHCIVVRRACIRLQVTKTSKGGVSQKSHTVAFSVGKSAEEADVLNPKGY